MASSLKLILSKSRRQITVLPSFHLSPYAYLSRSFSEKPDPPARPDPVTIQPVSYSRKPQQEQNPSPPSQENAYNQNRNVNNDREVHSEMRDANTMRTREDARSVKNVIPNINPVSYKTRVAPLPEECNPEHQPQQEQDPSPPSQENAYNQNRNLNNDTEVHNERRDGNTTWTREDARYVKNVIPNINPVSYKTRVAPLPEDREVGVEIEGGQLDDERSKIEADNRLLRTAFTRVFQEEEKVPFPTLIKVEKNKPREILDLSEAIRHVKANAKRNFEETIEAHVNLGIDGRRTDLSVSGTVTLPHGTGKVVKVAVFAEGSAADEAKAAGAYLVGGVELIEQILNGAKIDFDTCITTASFMPRVQKIGKILGKKGLMPNPKKGTVVSDITRAVKEAQRGRVSFKMDKTSNVHLGLGKVTFTEDNLRENIGAFVNALLLAKPAGLKKTSKFAGYVNSFHICSTMGPGYSVSIQSLSKAADHISRQQVK